MKGGIIGKIVGKYFKGIPHSFNENFEMFTPRSRFMDDKVKSVIDLWKLSNYVILLN